MSRDAVVVLGTQSPGWMPINHAARLLARIFDLDFEAWQTPEYSRVRFAAAHVSKAKRENARGVIYGVKSLVDVRALACTPGFYSPHRFRVLWVVDSFWTDYRPPARIMRHFDLVIYMQAGEKAFYESIAPGRAILMLWGTDTLAVPFVHGERPTDVLRVGRQPPSWDNDENTRTILAREGIRFGGRPKFLEATEQEPEAPYRALIEAYADCKFLIGFSNLAAPAPYTHPTKEYVTGRWLDALAAGAIPAGISPRGDIGFAERLWPNACLELSDTGLESNIDRIREAVDRWSPSHAARNAAQSSLNLDWRWQFKRIAEALSFSSVHLDQDLSQLADRAERLRATIEA